MIFIYQILLNSNERKSYSQDIRGHVKIDRAHLWYIQIIKEYSAGRMEQLKRMVFPAL